MGATNEGVESEDQTIVSTAGGIVQGSLLGETLVWKGIPYAEPPVGKLRWRAPLPAKPWEGMQLAQEFGAAAPQPDNPAVPLGPDITFSEDCLTLNIWRSSEAKKPLPVMVWIHGGAYTFGASCQPLFDATHLVETGQVLVVTINYRIGALGFLDLSSYSTEEHHFDSNLGLRDTILALQWVQENIGAFGGDPNQVTVFGESAGGGLVTTLLTVPSAQGLFHQAIAQSSPVSSVYGQERAANNAYKFLSHLSIPVSDVQRLIDLPVEQIVEAGEFLFSAVPAADPGTIAFAPVVDGDLVPEYPIKVLNEGRGLPVPLLIGTNKDEAAVFKFMKSPLLPITEDSIVQMLTEISFENPGVELPSREEVFSTYKGLHAHSVGLAVARDIGFRMPTIWAVEGHSKVAPVWLYRFDQTSPMLRLLGLGATHAAELPYLWGNLVAGPKDITFKLGGLRTAKEVSKRMQEWWRNFALYGSPTPLEELESVQQQHLWESFIPDGARASLIIDHQDQLVYDLDGPIERSWGEDILSFE